MHWIIDLLIDKLKREKKEDWAPEPLWIEDEYPERPDVKKEEKEKRIIIIDI